MKLLYITVRYPLPGETMCMYSDLMEEFRRNGHELHIVTLNERRRGRPTQFSIENGVPVLRVHTGNMFDTGPIEKGITLTMLPWQLKRAMAKYLPECCYDLILFATPPVTFSSIIEGLKRRQPSAKTYLMLKDIFPQNAKDLGMIRNPLLFWHFKRQERRLYASSDMIGCMSEANVEFLKKQNPEVPHSRIEVLPNTRTPGPDVGLMPPGPLRQRYGIPLDAVVLLYGGNMGKPQGLGFLMEMIEANRGRRDLHFLLVGSGTERARLAEFIAVKGLSNVTMIEQMPRADYEALARECNIGLVCLDPRFTIPNFPSRVLSFFETRMPVLAALDSATDFGHMLDQAGAGLWCHSGDHHAFQKHLDRLVSDADLRARMGAAGRHYLETHFTSAHAYQIISKHILGANV